MKKPIALLTTLMLLASPAYADWDEISNKMSELGDAVSDTAQDAWDDTKAFSKQAWQDFTNWSEEAINTAGEWTEASIEKSKEWIDAADKKIDELMEGDTPEEARQAVDLMADSALLKLFNEKPEAKAPAAIHSPSLPGADPDTSRVPPEPPCPAFGAKEIGSFNKLGTEVLAGYELRDGKCIALWDPVPVAQVVNNYVPDVGPTVSVAVTAAFATTAAILSKPIASVLQKLAKPITKKVVKKLLLKKEKPVSLRERILAQRDRNRALMALRRAVGK